MEKIEVGSVVINKRGEKGTITLLDGAYIYVDFNGRTVKFMKTAFLDGYLKYENEAKQAMVDDEIIEEKRRKAAEAEAKRIEELQAAEKRRAEREIEDRNSRSKNGKIHPYIDAKRNSGKHMLFLVCQNNNYENESNNGYIWAPKYTADGTIDTIASHVELEYVKAGDIIIHHFENRVWAISIAKSDCELKAAFSGHPNAGILGRFVETSYHFLSNPADTSSLKDEKIKFGSYKYGPFEKTGKNKEGFYLSELSDELAMILTDAAIAANPMDSDLKKIRSVI